MSTIKYLIKDSTGNIYTQNNGKIRVVGKKNIDYTLYNTEGCNGIKPFGDINTVMQEELISSASLDEGALFVFPLNKNQYCSSINGVILE